jgi:hypothetical protein
MGLHQTKGLLLSKENKQQSKEATYITGEKIAKYNSDNRVIFRTYMEL